MFLKKQIQTVLFALAMVPFVCSAKGETQPTFNIRFLKAKMIEAINQREVLVVFEVTGADKKNFPPVLSNTVKYNLGSGPLKAVTIGRGSNVRARAYKKDIQQKSTLVYGYIKDKVDLAAGQDLLFLAFYIRVTPDDDVHNMSFSYALAEKRAPKVRIEKKFDFEVEE
jgi:hypothetical protein